MPWVGTSRADVVARLGREGWTCEHGGKHDKFTHPERTYTIVVPRHRVLAMPTARSIAKAAGWL